MRTGLPESPLNPLPPVIWLLILPAIVTEAAFALGRTGLIGGAQGVGLRLDAINAAAFPPELAQRVWTLGLLDLDQMYRFLSFSFGNTSMLESTLEMALLKSSACVA